MTVNRITVNRITVNRITVKPHDLINMVELKIYYVWCFLADFIQIVSIFYVFLRIRNKRFDCLPSRRRP